MNKKKLALALGSGSARGLAHIGVLQVLLEENIRVDMIAGSSMGAVIGGIYSCGSDMYMLQKVVENMNERDYFDFVLPRRGLMRGQKFVDMIKIFTKQMTFEQTVIPFCCVATDVERGESVTLNKGKLASSIRASFAIPVVFEPQTIDGRSFVDGGVLDRVPGKPARDMGADVVIGVDVGYRGNGGLIENCTTVTDIIYNSLDIMQWEISKHAERFCDLVIAPDVMHINPNSAAQSNECIEQGRKATIQALPLIKELLD